MFLIFEREMCKKVKEWTDWKGWEMITYNNLKVQKWKTENIIWNLEGKNLIRLKIWEIKMESDARSERMRKYNYLNCQSKDRKQHNLEKIREKNEKLTRKFESKAWWNELVLIFWNVKT